MKKEENKYNLKFGELIIPPQKTENRFVYDLSAIKETNICSIYTFIQSLKMTYRNNANVKLINVPKSLEMELLNNLNEITKELIH